MPNFRKHLEVIDKEWGLNLAEGSYDEDPGTSIDIKLSHDSHRMSLLKIMHKIDSLDLLHEQGLLNGVDIIRLSEESEINNFGRTEFDQIICAPHKLKWYKESLESGE